METAMANSVKEEFVTIVSVGNPPLEPVKPEVPFVTVLSIGQQCLEEEVVVYRLPGEKLGFGLKFEGGTKSAECVKKLFIQSCAAETPAGRAKATWGALDAGDEILCIDRIPVTTLTRLECVRCLKDSNVAVKLLIRHFPEGKQAMMNGNGISDVDLTSESKASLPPPVPPRKIPRKRDNPDVLNGNKSSLEINHNVKHEEVRKAPLGKQSPGRPRRSAPINTPPPEAQYYIDATKENGIHIAESESDDTGSSISTVIDRLSAYSSFPGSVENSIPSTPTLGIKQINMQVLGANFDENFIIDHFNTKNGVNGNIIASDIFNELSNRSEDVMPQNPVVITLNSVKIEEVNSDANNNTSTVKHEKIVENGLVDHKVSEMPKPLPRNLIKKHVDSHSDENTFEEVSRVYDDSLSPTKLKNIETWLKDSINCSVDGERIDDLPKPEALPRLIDFVPKMKNQNEEPEKDVYKLSVNVKSALEDSDWGCSSPQLETIGEDDEDSPNCPTLPIIKVTPQPSSTNGESVFHFAKDSELAKDDTATPDIKHPRPEKEPEIGGLTIISRGARSPPDGRENPPVHQESPTIFTMPVTKPPDLPRKTSNTLPKKSPTPEQYQRSVSYEPVKVKPVTTFGRGKDVKSEGSVKDKIAMFSSQKTTNHVEKRNSKAPSQPQNRYSLNGDSLSKSYESLLDKKETKSPYSQERLTNGYKENGLSKTYKSYSVDETDKIVPILARDIQTCARNESHKSTIDYLIEQRRKSMTKIRGLVIPESPCIADLPEIKSRDSLKIMSTSILDRTPLDKSPMKKPISPTAISSMWDINTVLNNVPKYSPAFKRKSLQVYGPKTPPTAKPVEKIEKCANVTKPKFEDLDAKKSSYKSLNPIKKRPEIFSTSVDTVDNVNLKIFKGFSDNVDSDNDSAVSSTQSSYLSTVSSPTPSLNTVDNTESDCSSQSTMSRSVNAKPKYENGLTYLENKRNVCRSLSSDTSTSVGSSNSSTLTSGSQASCSSAGSSNPDSHRILKPRSIEAINRKNILASAKCRSGKDNKFGSPLIERKFSDDSTVESMDECEVKVKEKYNGDVVKYHNIKNRNISDRCINGEVKIAFSTLVVEDKCTLNKRVDTCSDTASDSDCDTKKIITKPVKKFANVNGERRSETYTKSIETKRLISNSEDDEQECFEVRLSRSSGGGIGVILAGGVDCEAKEVTIHKVLQGSAAERDGRLCKGDRIVSINGNSMRGVTHAQSVAILKDPQPEVSIIVRGKQPASDVANNYSSLTNDSSNIISVELEKADAPGGAGLGISLQGGGNRPLLINKMFTGGAAARSGRVESGSELLAAGGTKLVGLTRTEAWGLLRALPAGPVTLVLRPP